MALALAVPAAACAIGTTPIESDLIVPPEYGEPPSGDASATKDGGSKYGGDGSLRPDSAGRDAGPTVDAPNGNDAAVDTGAIDTGAPDTSTGRTDLCVGALSQQAMDIFGRIPYDDLCDAYYINTGGMGKPCGPSGASCAQYTGSDGFGPYCCYVPPTSGSFCRLDYGGVPQCLPQ